MKTENETMTTVENTRRNVLTRAAKQYRDAYERTGMSSQLEKAIELEKKAAA